METRSLVRERHPDAMVVEVPPIFLRGSNVRFEPGYWIVYSKAQAEAAELGRGSTEALAWAEAAKKLEPKAKDQQAGSPEGKPGWPNLSTPES